MARKSEKAVSYAKWPDDESARWVEAGNTFGRHLMASARDYAFGRIPKGLKGAAREAAEQAALDAIYGVLMLLDGVPRCEIDARHRVTYALEARIRNGSGDEVERIELAPEGDGLCMGYHGWVKGDFRAP